ncbi:hypothetical protein UPYG_G00279510 [Umbra pygmaea]|uniref:Uncharacterized protein n=1 Tax=Umbra pygmaea TaxID=75934 RepID=A0ABD0WII7_UMBPY
MPPLILLPHIRRATYSPPPCRSPPLLYVSLCPSCIKPLFRAVNPSTQHSPKAAETHRTPRERERISCLRSLQQVTGWVFTDRHKDATVLRQKAKHEPDEEVRRNPPSTGANPEPTPNIVRLSGLSQKH